MISVGSGSEGSHSGGLPQRPTGIHVYLKLRPHILHMCMAVTAGVAICGTICG